MVKPGKDEDTNHSTKKPFQRERATRERQPSVAEVEEKKEDDQAKSDMRSEGGI